MVSSQSFYDVKFNSLQVLRGICALLVVAAHIRFLSFGAFAVDIFLCLSGFMCMLSSHKTTTHFLIKRFFKIAPLYYSITIFTFFVVTFFPSAFRDTSGSLSSLFNSLLFIPFDVGNGFVQPLFRIGYFLNFEAFFYVLFFIACKISQKYRGLIASLFILTLILSGTFLSSFSFNPSVHNALLFWTNPILFDYILGIIMYYIAKKIYNSNLQTKTKSIGWLSLLIAIVIIVSLVLTNHLLEYDRFVRFLCWGIPSSIIVLLFFIAGLYINFPKSLIHIGDISYSIYILHYYPIQILDRKIDFSTLRPISLIASSFSVLLIIVLSHFSYKLIEKKFSVWCIKKLI